VIEARLRGEGIEPEPEVQEDRGNVIDLMAALKRSLGNGGGGEPKTRPAPASKTKAKPALKRVAKAPARKSESRAPARKPARKRA
jgi:DNA end-binding protein Ku